MPTASTRETFLDTVLPAMRTGLMTARDKGGELLDSDTAQEARRRGRAMMLAARGEPIAAEPGRRWLRTLGLVSLGCAIGAGIALLWQRLVPPAEYETYEPVDTMTRTDERIDLRAGMPR